MESGSIPRIQDLLWPTLLAVRELGGSARIQQINEKAMQLANVGDEQRKQLHGSKGSTTEVEYRLRWARTNLKGLGALENPSHATWSVTELGRTMTESSLAPKVRASR